MAWLDRLKERLGVLDPGEADALEEAPPRAERRTSRADRPPLDGIVAPSQESLEDALSARERGDRAEMMRLLRELDRGTGLRLVLHAAAALEEGAEAELAPLMSRVRGQEPAWRLPLQVAAVLEDGARADRLRTRAETAQAPRWALAWSRSLSADPDVRRRGLVELLVVDPALARTVAARDLGLQGARPDPDATDRYTAFAHGRECIRRFGAQLVADLLDRAGASP